MRGTAGAFISLLRPLQWNKNLLVFAALLFARQVHVPGQFFRAAVLFAAFCMVASALYMLNDIRDRRADRRHPAKRNRPVASGAISPEAALIAALSLAAAAFWVGSMARYSALVCLFGYAVLGVAYTFLLKRVVIVDVLAVSAGYVLRAAAGAFAIGVEISPWLIICTMLLALFLALAKRRHELAFTRNPRQSRSVLAQYSVQLLDQMIGVAASATLMAYILYAFSDRTGMEFPSRLMPLTIPFVLFGILRYLYLVHSEAETGEPERLLFRDRALMANLLLWLSVVAAVSIGR